MALAATDPIHETVNAVYLSESRRVLATLIGLLGEGFDEGLANLKGIAEQS